jgi:hypothetical protein
MGTVRTIAVVSLLLFGAVGGSTATGSVEIATDPDRGAAVAPQTNDTTNGSEGGRNDSLGGEISSFMQITAAGTEGAVDSGMWRASLNSTENETKRARMINARIEYLERWQKELEAETADLRADRFNNSSVSYVARASRLAARIEAFRTAVNQTAAVAAEETANETGPNDLEEVSANFTEPDLPAVDQTVRTGSTPSTGTPSRSAGTATPAPRPGSTAANASATPINVTTPPTNATTPSVNTTTPGTNTTTATLTDAPGNTTEETTEPANATTTAEETTGAENTTATTEETTTGETTTTTEETTTTADAPTTTTEETITTATTTTAETTDTPTDTPTDTSTATDTPTATDLPTATPTDTPILNDTSAEDDDGITDREGNEIETNEVESDESDDADDGEGGTA